jgi:hypothetical protein
MPASRTISNCSSLLAGCLCCIAPIGKGTKHNSSPDNTHESTADLSTVLPSTLCPAPQGILGLFGLLAAIFAFYGMGAANKGVLGGVWVVVGDMTTFATNVTTQVDNLLGSISNISTAVGDFQNVVRNDLDVPGFRTNLTVRREAGRKGAGGGVWGPPAVVDCVFSVRVYHWVGRQWLGGWHMVVLPSRMTVRRSVRGSMVSMGCMWLLFRCLSDSCTDPRCPPGHQDVLGRPGRRAHDVC